MTEFVDLLIAEQANPSAALLQILVSDYATYDVIVAVEGPDDRTFYFDFIAEYVDGMRFNIITCGGKRGVVGLRSLVDEYEWDEKPTVLYLCDKDFDDYIGAAKEWIYYLPVYSVESFFTTNSYVSYILKKFCKGNLSEDERQFVLTTFEDMAQPMIRDVRLIASLMIELRSRGKHPDFDALSVADFLELSSNPPRPKAGRWTTIRTSWSLAEIDRLDGGELRARARRLSAEDHTKWLRGKYALQLAKAAYLKTLKKVPEDVSQRCPDANMFSTEVLKWAKLFLGEIPCLKDYCANIAGSR